MEQPWGGELDSLLSSPLVVSRSAEVVVVLGVDGRGVMASPSIRTVLGYTPEQALSDPLSIVHPLDRPWFEEAVVRAADSPHEELAAPVRMVDVDGNMRRMQSFVGAWTPNAASGPTCVVLLRDVTALAQAEQRAAELEQRCRMMSETSSDAAFSTSVDGTLRWMSDAAIRLVGCDEADVLGRRLQHFIHPDDFERLSASETDASPDAAPAECRVRWRCGDDAYRWVALSVRPVLDPQGRRVARVGRMRDIDGEVRAQEAFLSEHERLTAMLHATMEPHVELRTVRDEQGVIVDFVVVEANDAACVYMGMEHGQLVGARLEELRVGETRRTALDMFARVVQSGQRFVVEDLPDGSPSSGDDRRFDLRAVKIGDGVAVTWRDVTDRFRMAEALAATEQDFRLLAESIGDVVRVIDLNGIQTWVSPSVTKLLGYKPEELVGTYAQAIMHPDDFSSALALGMRVGMSKGTVTPPRRTRVRHADGHWVWTETTNSFAYDDDGNVTHLYAVTRDAQAQVEAEMALQWLATTDPLTGLLNRGCILDRLEALASDAPASGSTTAVLFCDLDNLKAINDTLGHAAGDAVIAATAHRAKDSVGSDALVARFGGDEILVVLPRVEGLDRAQAIAEDLRKSLSRPVVLPVTEDEVGSGVSVGVALLRPGESVDDVISRADAAMYRAKSTGRNAVIPAT